MTSLHTEIPERPQPPASLPPRVAQARQIIKGHAIQKYHEGAIIPEVCEDCGISDETFRLWRREEGLVQAYAPRGHCWLEAHTDEIKEAWDAGELLRVIAARYGTTCAKISVFAKRMGWPRRTHTSGTGPRRRAPAEWLDEIKALWDAGMSAIAISRRFGFSDAGIRNLARRLGWPRRGSPEESLEREERIFQFLQQGLSRRGVARNMGLALGTVSLIMRRRGWSPRPGASDQLAGAPPPQEEALVPARPGPRTAPRLPLPTGLGPEAAAARQVLKDFAIRLNQRGLTIPETCGVCGITPDTLTRWRREEGITLVQAARGHCWMEEHLEELREDWLRDENESLGSIAGRYGLHRTQLSEFASQQGWPQRSLGRKKDSPDSCPVLPYHLDEVRALWDAGLSAVEIGRRFGVTGTAVGMFARSRRFPRRPTVREQREELVFQCFQDGLPLRTIARVLGYERMFVVRLVRDRGWRR